MNDEIPLLVALIAAFVTAGGWITTHHLTKRKEDRVRRIENNLKHLERQIEEFYGPLFCLVNQIFVCNDVQDDILSGRENGIDVSPDNEDKIRDFFQSEYFLP